MLTPKKFGQGEGRPQNMFFCYSKKVRVRVTSARDHARMFRSRVSNSAISLFIVRN